MASIAKRPNGSWRARYRDGVGKEHAKDFRRKVDAQSWLDNVTTAVQTGAYTDPRLGRTTVAEYSQLWLTRQAHLKPSTRSRYLAILRVHVEPRFGASPLARLERSDMTAWLGELAQTSLSPATIRHIYKVFYGVLQSAMQDGRIARNPAAGVKLPRAVGREKRFLDHEQVAHLANAAGEDRLIILVLAYCGLRFGELAALRVRNIDMLRRRLHVEQSATEVDGRMIFGTPKGPQRREVGVPRSMVEALARACEGKSRDDLLFTSPNGRVIYLRNWRSRVFDKAVAEAGLGRLSPHELRHTAASLAVGAGANVKAVQRMLGHASAAMTLDTYSGLFEDDLDSVADRLDQAAARALDRAANEVER
jgi:integrase